MSLHNVDLSALISTRICHDLISPIGAINNGLELLGAVDKTASPELSLVSDSASAASAKLNIFRLAFGEARQDSEIQSERIVRMIGDMYKDTRLTVVWQPTRPGYVRAEAKLALLLLFCLETSMPLGGTCQIVSDSGSWSFKASASRWNIRDPLWNITTGDAPLSDVSASDVHYLIARLTATEIGRKIALHHKDDELFVTVV